jgi:hypothetical protein
VARCSCALLLFALLAACHKDAAEERRKSLRSWRSTLELVQSEEKKHNVPPVYVKQVRELAAEKAGK